MHNTKIDADNILSHPHCFSASHFELRYRANLVPRDQLPPEVTSRPDCHWGRNWYFLTTTLATCTTAFAGVIHAMLQPDDGAQSRTRQTLQSHLRAGDRVYIIFPFLVLATESSRTDAVRVKEGPEVPFCLLFCIETLSVICCSKSRYNSSPVCEWL
jgi:hypothetical protein